MDRAAEFAASVGNDPVRTWRPCQRMAPYIHAFGGGKDAGSGAPANRPGGAYSTVLSVNNTHCFSSKRCSRICSSGLIIGRVGAQGYAG